MKFVIIVLQTFYHRWIIFGWIWAFTFENHTERTFTYDFILMSWTLLLLIKDGILFGKVLKLEKHLNHIIRRSWRADFNFNLIMIPPWLLIRLLKLELLHQYKIILFEFLLDWIFENVSNISLIENLLDWKRLKSNVFEKFTVLGVKIPECDYKISVIRLRWNNVNFIVKIIKLLDWRLVRDFLF